MTESEIHTIMTNGFSTIAGSVMAAYISFGVSKKREMHCSACRACDYGIAAEAFAWQTGGMCRVVLLLLRSATQQADNGFTSSDHAAWCLDVRKFHEIYGTTERAIVAEGAWTAKALGSSTSAQGPVSSSEHAICTVSGHGSTGETRMLNPVLLFAQVSAGHLVTASIMSAPAALVYSKLLYPETEESRTHMKNIVMPQW
ncbi:hypothetical protein HPB49_007402 [Dermacentor silvarum]|uniref:Uncharacterized protein n=1 Tax=Dermacentor silvarum TaxID=543639 RepID=A0ACB8CDR0_DERSI|nr:hypothetical protein HPB49_007402 [Dermacentor silvarum]